MPQFIAYVPQRFQSKSELNISRINDIIDHYAEMGLSLTVRQIYYQFVANDWIPNSQQSYDNLQELINKARLAGRVDWEAIEDRTRNVRAYPTWESPDDAVEDASISYREDKWKTQKKHVEIWVEKDALIGVAEMASRKWETPFFSCRGYTSQSELWASAQRLATIEKPAIILHLGDHDPSGCDMTRDIAERMELFEAFNVTVNRIALNMDQIRKFNPPPNPAKLTDARAKAYIRKHGPKSWELDALKPEFLIDLIQAETERHIDKKAWKVSKDAQESNRAKLEDISGDVDLAARFVMDDDARAWFRDHESDA